MDKGVRVRERAETQQPPINERIRFPRVQLITHEGKNIGVVPRETALRMAYEAGLDLVLIADQGADGIPVVKIMDFGKARYAKKKKHAEARKTQKVIQVKEIKMSPKIGEHDFLTKMNQAIEFLNDGKRVKMTLFFRGREMATKEERGTQFFEKINRYFDEQGILKNMIQEPDARLGQLWSRVCFLKTTR
jgi:translation initiation factor IF-3